MKKEAALIKNSRDPGEALESSLAGWFKLRTTKKWRCKLAPDSEYFSFFKLTAIRGEVFLLPILPVLRKEKPLPPFPLVFALWS